jgi:Protein of unknown function (DUF998)
MTNTLTVTLHRERAVERAHRGGLVALPRRRDVAAMSTRERRSLLNARRWVAVAGAAAGAVLYSNWLLEIVFTRRLPNPHEWISELAALDQPHGEWFRCGDRATAIICLIATAAALVGARGGRWSRIGWWLVGVFAVATALDSTVCNMVCAPSSNDACAVREASGAVPIGHQLHLFTSSIAVVASILSMILFVVADSVEPTPASVRRVGRYMLAAVMTTQIWTGIEFAIDKGNASSGQVGLAEQAELIATAGWLIYVALRTAYAPTGNTSAPPAKTVTTETGRPSSSPETPIRSVCSAAGSAAGRTVRHARVTTSSHPDRVSSRPRTPATFPAPPPSRRPARHSTGSLRSSVTEPENVCATSSFESSPSSVSAPTPVS